MSPKNVEVKRPSERLYEEIHAPLKEEILNLSDWLWMKSPEKKRQQKTRKGRHNEL